MLHLYGNVKHKEPEHWVETELVIQIPCMGRNYVSSGPACGPVEGAYSYNTHVRQSTIGQSPELPNAFENVDLFCPLLAD